MPAKVIVGAQWGDEGKGKLIDIYASQSDVVVRSQGGNNAGHTVEYAGQVYKLHLVPSGILYAHTLNLVGCGVVIDPASFLTELDSLKGRGIPCSNLRIDPRAHVVMPWHILMDGLSEDARGKLDIGTTRRGIGPCYMDKAERIGIRVSDLLDEKVLREKIAHTGKLKNNILTKLYDQPALDLDGIAAAYADSGKRLAPYVDDVSILTWNAVNEGKKVLFEGAQGSLLDLDMGTYPYVTSSHPLAGGFCTGTGIGPGLLQEIIGVAKAYTTRVGKGPFPTELLDDTGESLRKKGNEYGTTTGRPRRVGWFDSVVLRHSVRVNGLTGLAVNKFDTLCGMDTLKICVAYRKPDGTVLHNFPATMEELEKCEAVYEELPGYDGDLSGCKSFDALPEACKRYIGQIEELCGCPVVSIGVGPGRDQNIER